MAQTKETSSMDRYAIIQTGGKQYQALEGKTLGIEKLDIKEGDAVTFDKVLLRKTGPDSIEVGKPFLDSPVKAKVVIIPQDKKEPTLSRTVDWLGTPKFIESNFILASTQKEVLRVGNFNVETIKVSSGNKTFWFSISADGSSRYPELIRAVRGNQVLVNLRQIIRPKKSKK